MCALSAKEIGYLEDTLLKAWQKLALLSILTMEPPPPVSFVKLAN